MRGKLLAFAVVEIGTALVVLVVPRLVVELLLGGDVAGIGRDRPCRREAA